MIKHKQIPDFEFERFFKFIMVDPANCWIYSGDRSREGYGRFYINKKAFLAHRVSWKIFHGSLTSGLVIDHICMNKKCINPDHLREVSIRTNVMENSNGLAYLNSIKTLCKNGHPLEARNLQLSTAGHRRCLTCIKEYKSNWSKKRRELKSGVVNANNSR